MFMQDATRFVAAEAAHPAAPVRAGLTAATLVETAQGWRPAASLRRGDRVQSFDGGLREIVALGRDWLAPGSCSLLHLPGGLLGAMADIALLPGQHLLLDTWDDLALTEAVVALVPAEAAHGLGGATLRPVTEPTEIVMPVFAEEEAIHTNGGLLLHCPGIDAAAAFYPRLALPQARALLRGRLAVAA